MTRIYTTLEYINSYEIVYMSFMTVWNKFLILLF